MMREDARGVVSALAQRKARQLIEDDRGVIMVIGVFFTLFLIGCTWFIFGIGGAIAYRENLQNAADSAAFAAAVYDARGMNLLALINIIMGVALAFLVVARIAEYVYIMAQLADCQSAIDEAIDSCILGCELVPYAVAECTSDCSSIKSMQSKVKTFDGGLHTALKVLHYGEVGIAVGWPWIAAGKSGNMQGYWNPNSIAVMSSFAYSQIPWNLDTLAGSAVTGNSQSAAPANTRYGLPVTSDTYSHLCSVVFYDFSNLGGIVGSNPISSVINGAMSLGSQWLCDDETGNVWGAFPTEAATTLIEQSDLVFPLAVIACDLENISQLAGLITGSFGSAAQALSQLPMSTTNDYVNAGQNQYGGVLASQIEYAPMMLYPPAKMGLDYFGIWSTAIGNYTDTPSSKAVQIAGIENPGGAPTVAGFPADVSVGIAKAEFYYDPGNGDSTTNELSVVNGKVSDPTHDVLWNMRWRARLRRYHYFPGMTGQIDQIISLMGSSLKAIFDQTVAGALNGQSPTSIINGMIGSEVSVDSYTNTPPPQVPGQPKIYH